MDLKHKNLLPPSDVFKEKKSKYAVYEYSRLDNLHNYLKRKVKITEKVALNIMNQIIDGYQFLRENEFIHGNIKPTNILVNGHDKLTIKLTDFLLQLKKKSGLLNDNFIAPEIVSGEIHPNIISDIYSIGAIIKLLTETTESSSSTSLKLIQDCLQSDPTKRIQFDILRSHPYFTSIPPIYKVCYDTLYICTCTKGDGISLVCKDSFCSGCILELIYREKFNKRSLNFFKEEIDSHIWPKIKLKCPKCLTVTERGKSI